MTDRQGTVEGEIQEGQDQPQWRVEGSESSEDGLGDTVVRLPRITEDTPAPSLPAPPKARTSRTGRTGAVTGKGSEPTTGPASRKPAPEVKEPLDMPTQIKAPSVTPAAAPPVPLAAATVAPAPVLPPAPFSGSSAYGAPSAFAEPTAVPSPSTGFGTPTSPATASKSSGLRRTRKARLRLSRVDPWSVMKTSFLFSIAFGIMFWVAVSVLWWVVQQSGLFDAINQQVQNTISSPNAQVTWRIEDYINGNKVLGITALLAVINVVISTALGTLTAFLYNLSANILGGLELTLAED